MDSTVIGSRYNDASRVEYCVSSFMRNGLSSLSLALN